MIIISTVVIHEVNRKNNLSDEGENFFEKIYSLMGVSINLYMLMKEIYSLKFPMMLVLSLACTLAACGYYFMQLPPIHLLSAVSRVPTC